MPEFEKAVVLLIRVSDCPVVKQGSVFAVSDIVSVYDSGAWTSFNAKFYLRHKIGLGQRITSSASTHKLAEAADKEYTHRGFLCSKPSAVVERGSLSLVKVTLWPMKTSSCIVTPSQMKLWLEILHFLPITAPF